MALDCETDRIRWEEADKLRNREISLLRRDVKNLQDDMERLVARSVDSGVVSRVVGHATTTPPLSNKPKTSET